MGVQQILHICVAKGALSSGFSTYWKFKVYNANFTGSTPKNWDTEAVSQNKDHFLEKN